MIKKTISLILVLCLSFLLTGCLGDSSIDELLSAPSRDQKQQNIISVLEQEVGTQITFVYPYSGNIRSAIQFIDIDGCGSQEAIVFYRNTVQSPNACLAVLKSSDEKEYYVAATQEGEGDQIASCVFLRQVSDGSRHILLEWSYKNLSANKVTAYTFTGTSLERGFEERCTNLTVLENIVSGSSCFCYIIPSSRTALTLKTVEFTGSVSILQSETKLSTKARAVKNISTGNTPDGKLIFIDEITSSGLQTQIFSCDQNFRLLDAIYSEGYSVTDISSRDDDADLGCRNIDGFMCFPSKAAPFKGVLKSDAWTYWYTVSEGSPSLKLAGHLSKEYGCIIPVPDEWLRTASLSVPEDAPGTFLIYEPATNKALMKLIVMSVDEDARGFTSGGYRLIASGGGHRYYALFDCSPEQEQFIENNFIIL